MPVDLVCDRDIDQHGDELLGTHHKEVRQTEGLARKDRKLAPDEYVRKHSREELREHDLGVLHISEPHSSVHIRDQEQNNAVDHDLEHMTLEIEISQRFNYAVLEMEIPMETEGSYLESKTSHHQ